MAEWYSTGAYTTFSLFIYPIDGYLDGFYVFTIVNNAVKNMEVQLPLCDSDFISFS